MSAAGRTDRIIELFGSSLSVVNLGLESFADNLASLGTDVIKVDWRPPAGGHLLLLP